MNGRSFITYHAGFFVQHHPASSIALYASVIIVAKLFEISITMPIAWGMDKPTREIGGVILQTTPNTCGPSALATIAKLYGKTFSEKEAALLCQTTSIGTFTDELIRGAKRMGFSFPRVFIGSCSRILPKDLPFVILDDIFKQTLTVHAVAVIGVTQEEIILADPMFGIVKKEKGKYLQEPHGLILELGSISTNLKLPLLSKDFWQDRLRGNSKAN